MAITGFRRGEPAASASARVGLDSSQRAVLELAGRGIRGGARRPRHGQDHDAHRARWPTGCSNAAGARTRCSRSRPRARARRACGMRSRCASPVPRAAPWRARSTPSPSSSPERRHARQGPPPPRFITGGEQDADIADLLAGNIEDGTGPVWPKELGPEVRGLRPVPQRAARAHDARRGVRREPAAARDARGRARAPRMGRGSRLHHRVPSGARALRLGSARRRGARALGGRRDRGRRAPASASRGCGSWSSTTCRRPPGR